MYVAENGDKYSANSTKHSITILGEADINGLGPNKVADEDDDGDQPEETYLPSRTERFVNYLLCRCSALVYPFGCFL